MRKNKLSRRYLISIILFILVFALEIFEYICKLSTPDIFGKFTWQVTFIFIIEILFSGLMVAALILKRKPAITLLYILLKGFDGIYHPIAAFTALESSSITQNWSTKAGQIAYLVCGLFLFLSLLCFIIKSFHDKKIFHVLVELFLLIAVLASFLNIIFQICDVSLFNTHYIVIIETVYQTVLYIALFLVNKFTGSLIVHKED